MQIIKCVFEKDVQGIWFLPALGYSNIDGDRSLWVGWICWMVKIEF